MGSDLPLVKAMNAELYGQKTEVVNELPKGASFIDNENEHANNFTYFSEPEVLVYYTVTGSEANDPNKIIKEEFVAKRQ